MSNLYNKTYYCKSCTWEGLWPNVIKTENKDGDATIIAYKVHCPRCDHEFTYEELK